MHTFLKLIIGTLAVLVADYLLEGIIIEPWYTTVIVAIVLGILNTFVKPLLVLLTLPINILTLGLFTLVINALLVMLAGLIIPGFVVVNFWWAVLFSIIITIVSSFLHLMNER